MAIPENSPIAATENVVRDGITYEVVAVKIADEFHSDWLCTSCGERGDPPASLVTYATVRDAVAQAKINLVEHHRQTHVSE
jgi:hypothetical protein